MRNFVIGLMLLLLHFQLSGQGCSDAGFCTIADMDSGFEKASKKSYLHISEIAGLGEQQTLIFTTQLDMNVMIDKDMLQLRVPYHFIKGNIGENYGIGDLSISYSRQLHKTEKHSLSLILAGKIPVNRANDKYSGLSLPMVYQRGLGTYDLILGINYKYEKWHIAFAYQYPFGQNENSYTHDIVLENTIIPEYYLNYNESYLLERSDDLMLRIERVFTKESNQFILGLLPLYHIRNDKIQTHLVQHTVQNSKGITVNINAKANWKISEDMKFNTQLAFPVLAREKRPDGLTRTVVVSAGIMYNLN